MLFWAFADIILLTGNEDESTQAGTSPASSFATTLLDKGG